MSWIFIADDGEQVHYDVPPRVVELEQQLAELKILAEPLTQALYKEMSERHTAICVRLAELEAELAEQKDFVSEGQDRLEASLVEKGNAFDKIRRLEADVGNLITRIADERSKTLEQMRNERIKELGSEIATRQARIDELEQQLAELRGLLSLIRDDLRMRSEDGVVDLSDFIWMRMDKALLESSDE